MREVFLSTYFYPESVISADIDLCNVITTRQVYSSVQCTGFLGLGILVVSQGIPGQYKPVFFPILSKKYDILYHPIKEIWYTVQSYQRNTIHCTILSKKYNTLYHPVDTPPAKPNFGDIISNLKSYWSNIIT